MSRMGYLGFMVVLTVMGFAEGPERFRLPAVPGVDEYVAVPEENPLTPEKIALGRRLFFDRQLSSDRTVACASCHQPERAFSDNRRVAVGAGGRQGRRNAPAILNRAYGQSFFWDGREPTLEAQALHSIQDPLEMNLTLAELTARLQADPGYPAEFHKAFPDGITAANVARALASYVRTVRSGDSPYDRFQNGKREALSEEAQRGLELFRGKANCIACHIGPNLTDEQFHNTGVSWGSGDLGRYKVTGEARDRGAFKTPTLREVARTAPYMHDGSIATLEAVIAHYDRGGKRNPYLDPELRPLRLTTQEKQELLAFLRALSGTVSEGVRR